MRRLMSASRRGRARNVDAFVAELHVLAQVPTMQNNDCDGADNRCEGAGAPEQKEKGVHDAVLLFHGVGGVCADCGSLDVGGSRRLLSGLHINLG